MFCWHSREARNCKFLSNSCFLDSYRSLFCTKPMACFNLLHIHRDLEVKMIPVFTNSSISYAIAQGWDVIHSLHVTDCLCEIFVWICLFFVVMQKVFKLNVMWLAIKELTTFPGSDMWKTQRKYVHRAFALFWNDIDIFLCVFSSVTCVTGGRCM